MQRLGLDFDQAEFEGSGGGNTVNVFLEAICGETSNLWAEVFSESC